MTGGARILQRRIGSADSVQSDPRPASAASIQPVPARALPTNQAAHQQTLAVQQRATEPMRPPFGAGQQLPDQVRAPFERAFQQDFSSVRLHTESPIPEAYDTQALTYGGDIAIAPGRFSPDTVAGQRVLAHELAHVVQQSRGGTQPQGFGDSEAHHEREANCAADAMLHGRQMPALTPTAGPMVQGWDGDEVCELPEETEAPVCEASEWDLPELTDLPPVPEVPAGPGLSGTERRLVRQMNYLTTLRTLRDRAVAARRDRDRAERGAYGTGPGIGVFPGLTYGARRHWNPANAVGSLPGRYRQVEQAETLLREGLSLVELSSASEIEQIQGRFLDLFQRKALEMANHLLDQSEQRASQEQERYRSAPVNTCNTTLDGLKAAAAILAPLQQQLLQAMRQARDEACSANPYMPCPGEDFSPANMEQYLRGSVLQNSEPVQAALRAFVRERQNQAREYPVLGSEGLDYQSMSEMSNARLKPHLVTRSEDVLTAISTARGRLDADNVWELDPVLNHTMALLGITAGGPGAQAVQARKAEHAANQAWIDLFLAAAAITLAVVATVASGGTSLLAMGVYGTATAGMAGLGVAQAYRSYQRYEFESATREAAFARARAIGNREPSLAWLALDVAFAFIDIGQAIHAFSRLIPAARSVMAIRSAALAGEGVDTAEALASFRRSVEAQARELGQGEAFIERLMRSAERLLETGTQQARRQVAIQSELLNPSAPGFSALVRGDRRALRNLLVEYGSWEHLQQFLNTARMEEAARAGRAAAQQFDQIGHNLVLYRNEILTEVQRRFGAEPLGTASTTRVSDVDLSTYSIGAGEDLIRAETYMMARFGENWSAALRMNFYTDAQRLAAHALDELALSGLQQGQRLPALMRGMDPQAAALLMREVADRTQLYTSARQLRFAQGNEQLMRRILDDVPEQFRERVRTLAQMDPAAEMARRNELLRGQDDLVRQLLTADERTRPALLRRLSLNQIALNFHTFEATIAPGALRQIAVPGSRLAGWPAVGAAQSHFADALHILHEEGSAARAGSRYEFYKYMKRFTVAARSAGEGADPRLAELERLAERFANMRDTQRIEAALSEAERSRIVQLFTDYYFEAVGRMRQNAVRNPHDWGETGSLARGGSEPLEGLPTSRYRPLVPTSVAGSLRRAGEAEE